VAELMGQNSFQFVMLEGVDQGVEKNDSLAGADA